MKPRFACKSKSEVRLWRMRNVDGIGDLLGCHTPHPGPLPVEGRGRRAAASHTPSMRVSRVFLSPQRGEGRGEGCDNPKTSQHSRSPPELRLLFSAKRCSFLY